MSQMSQDHVTKASRAATDDRPAHGTVGGRRAEAWNVLGSALLSSFGVTVALQLWRMDLSVPLSVDGDSKLALSTIRTLQVSGWYLQTDWLNAPVGQDMRAYPGAIGDTWNMVGLKALSLALSPAQTLNIAFLLGFPLVAAVACWSFGRLRLNRWTAITLGAVYSWLPYHFLHGEPHIFLSTYAVLPLACLLVLAALRRDLEFGKGSRRTWLGALSVAVLLGGSGLYYAAFIAILVVSAGVLASLAGRTIRPLLGGLLLAATSGITLLAAAAPTIAYLANHGAAGVEGRSYAAVEFYGLKITGLIAPVQDHRIHLFAVVRHLLSTSYIPGENMDALGLAGAAGFVIVCIAGLVHGARRDSLIGRLSALGTVTLVAVLWATVAGLSGVLALVGLTQVRGWARMSVVIAFLALAGLGLVIDTGVNRLRFTGRWRAASAPTAAVLLAVVALFDQTTSAMVPSYSENATRWANDATYFARLETELGAGAAIFQLPVVPFPENPPVVNMPDYEHLRGFLHSDLRWSYGGVRGATTDWQSVAMARGIEKALPALVSAGFSAVYVDRDGYADHGAQVETELVSVLGDVAPVVNADGSLAVYDLRAYAKTLSTVPDSRIVLDPARLTFGAGFYSEESDDTSSYRWAAGSASATVSGYGSQQVRLTGIVNVTTDDATVDVSMDGRTTTLRATGGVVQLDLPLTVHAGSVLTVTTGSAPAPKPVNDTRDLRQKFVGLTLEPTW